MQKKGLIRKVQLISKFSTSQAGQIITIHTLSSISRNKGNQTMRQLSIKTIWSVNKMSINKSVFVQTSCRK